jgi:alkaline phosphatase D
MKKLILTICFGLMATLSGLAQAELLQSGPMVGYSSMREALLWVQTTEPAEVYFSYSSGEEIYRTARYTTSAAEAFTARLIADQVQPGQSYVYQLYINGEAVERPYDLAFQTPPLWQYRTEPPEMRFAMGSCTFVNEPRYDRPGNGYGGGYDIFQTIAQEKPDFMLWLGDNVYLREPDFYSRTGIMHRYTHTRSLPEIQPLLAITPNYAIWDDHDYGPNNSDRSYREKETTLEAFRLFWGNPTYGVDQHVGATVSMFQWGDADFFLLDDRYYRSPNYLQGERSILGEAQLQWIIDALVSSRAKWKFVCVGGQMLNPVERYETFANISPSDREALLDAIGQHELRNVIFLTGDRHHSELSLTKRNGIKIYDFTASPLTSGSHDASDEANELRVEGSHVGIRNYGMIEITGPRQARKLSFAFYDAAGEELWRYDIEEQPRD